MNPIELDIFRSSRYPFSEYEFDVFAGDEWIASAKNNHAADDIAAEAWYRALLSQPVIADVPAGNTDADPPGVNIAIEEAPDEEPAESRTSSPQEAADTTLLDDLASVLTLIQHVFVGQSAHRAEIRRVLDRYAAERFDVPDLSAEAQRAAIVLACARMLLRDSSLIAA